jgi:hypothetical protein
MTSHPDSKPDWGRQYRAIASEKWKAKSAVMGQPVTDALVEYAQPQPGIRMLIWPAEPAGLPSVWRRGEEPRVTSQPSISAQIFSRYGAAHPRTRVQELHHPASGCAYPCLFPRTGSISHPPALRDVLLRSGPWLARTAARFSGLGSFRSVSRVGVGKKVRD